jgi:hypothetical protein
MLKTRLALGLSVIAGVGLVLSASGGACTASETNQFTGGTGGTSSGNATGGANTASGTGGEPTGVLFDGGGNSDAGFDPDAGCVGQPFKSEQLPLDMYIMLDQSGSMSAQVPGGLTRWDACVNAITTFVQQPNPNGVSVGIQYFALPDSCNWQVYANPEVEIAPLPGNTQAIINSLAAHGPSTGTPTIAAMQGGIAHCKDWANANPGHVVVHLHVTDGEPGECDSNINNIANIAAAGSNGIPKILTFVIGVGSSLQNLNTIAAAGGTGQAFLVDTNANAQQQFLDALNKIRGTALGCVYTIPQPDAGILDYKLVNVKYSPGNGGPVQFIPKVDSKAQCPTDGTDGWYYDDEANPSQIILCDGTCSKVSADGTGQIDIVLGCTSVIP